MSKSTGNPFEQKTRFDIFTGLAILVHSRLYNPGPGHADGEIFHRTDGQRIYTPFSLIRGFDDEVLKLFDPILLNEYIVRRMNRILSTSGIDTSHPVKEVRWGVDPRLDTKEPL